MTRSEELFQRAVKRIPGGVNSPVRAFGSVDEAPRFIQGAVGSKIFDVDGNTYTDYIGSWGPMILGHNDERVKEAVIRASENGLSLAAPLSGKWRWRNLSARGSLMWNDPYGQFRNRSSYERYPHGQRIYGKE